MRTSALASPDAYAAPAITLPVAMVSEPMDRRLKWDAAVSVLLHLGLLLMLSISWLEATDSSAVPGPWLQIYLPDGRETEPDIGAARKLPVAPTTSLSKAFPAVVAASRATDIESPHDVALFAPAQAPDATAGDSIQPQVPAGSESASPAEAPVFAATGDSGPEPPMRTDSARTELPQLAIPTSQRAMLTRQVTKLAQGLRNTDLAPAQLAWQDQGQRYTAVLTRQPAVGDTDIERVVVEIMTEEGGKRMRTQFEMKRLAFSHFTQLVDNWDTSVQLHDDEIAGRFHSNSEIFVGYDSSVAPRFLGKVTTAARGFTISSSSGRKRRDDIFRAGIETQAGRIVLPEKFLSVALDQAAKNAELRSFTRDTRITFYSDGSYGWQTLGSQAPEQRQAMSTARVYIAGARHTSVYLRGTVSGSVLVYSPELIVIEGDLIYAHDPRSAPDASDYMALVSDKDIEIARPVVTGPGNLEIDAAVYARRRFIVTDEDARGNATLFIYGSLTAGSISATEPRYATKVVFDPRFEHVRPPGFPMTNRYEVEAWDTHWEHVETNPEP